MPARIRFLKERLVMSRLMLKLVQVVAFSYVGSALFGSEAGDVLLLVAIFVGQAERRPMTAAKLAEYVGIPRPTVVRRLRALQEAGLIHLDASGAATCDIARLNTAAMDDATQQAIRAVHNAAAELSKMDAKGIADHESAVNKQRRN